MFASQDGGAPVFHKLVELPTPLASTSQPSPVFEYPTAIATSPSRWCISDGTGRLYLVTVDRSTAHWTGHIAETFELLDDSGALLPCRLHAASEQDGGTVSTLLSIPVKVAPVNPAQPEQSEGLSTSARSKIPSTTAFEYLQVPLPSSEASEDISMDSVGEPRASTPLNVRWRFRAADLPSFVAYDPKLDRYTIGAASTLSDATSSEPAAGTTLSGPSSFTSTTTATEPVPTSSQTPALRPPPFSWTQDKDSVTLAFAIPSSTPTSSIRVTFSRQYLTLHIGSASSALCGVASSSLPRISHKQFWDLIDPHTSVWTFDRDAEGRDSTFGILSLHLEKAHPGTKWTDVFSPTPAPTTEARITELSEEEQQQELERVPETVDPSELAAIAESMEQWSRSVVEAGRGADVEGLGTGLPTSLMGEEIDVEVDGDSGRPLVVTWIEGATLAPSPTLVQPHPTIPFSLLSTPLPTFDPSRGRDFSLTIKHDVDGLLYSPPATAASGYAWTHTSTFPALAFVLATKTDASFIYHLSSRAVLAFDSPSHLSLTPRSSGGHGGAGNLFVYCKTTGPKDTTGRQLVLKIGGPESGALVGVAGVELGEETLVVALCEKELVLFRIL